jgi:hypothetical protein
MAKIIEKRLVLRAIYGVWRINELVRWTGHGFARYAFESSPKNDPL